MKAKHWIMIVALGAASSYGGAMAWSHYHKPPLPYFTQPVRVQDIESTVTALGQIDPTRASVEAAVSEADIFKLHPGQPVFFNLVALPDQRFQGVVRDVRVIPIGVPTPEAPEPPKKDANGNPLPTDTDGVPIDPDTGVRLEPKSPQSKQDAYSSGKDGVFYRVLFDMGSAAGRFPVGMSVTVNVVLGVAKGVPTIPMMALGRSIGENRYQIEVLGPGDQPIPREVTTGLSDNLSIEVKSGVRPADTVVIRADPSIYEPGYRG